MMRTGRIVIPGMPYHITHRGVSGERIFLDDEDFLDYRELLTTYASTHGLSVLAYCLMPTHMHAAGIPATKDAMACAIGYAHNGYAKHFNARYHQHGCLWHERFYSCPMDIEHLLNALRYIERNPVRAGLVNHAWEYSWSSATAHITGVDPTGLLDLDWWHRHFDGAQWQEYLCQPEDDTWLDQLRQHTQSGRPLGSESFLQQLEKATGLSLHTQPRGRPKRNYRHPRCDK